VVGRIWKIFVYNLIILVDKDNLWYNSIMSKDAIIEILSKEKPYLVDKYSLTELGLFGSSVRGGENLLSDVDVLFDFDRENSKLSLFDIVDIKNHLEKVLGRTVDIIDKKMLKTSFRKQILEEVVMV